MRCAVRYLGAVVDSLQDCRKVWAMLRTVLPTLGHNPIATNNTLISDMLLPKPPNLGRLEVGGKAV